MERLKCYEMNSSIVNFSGRGKFFSSEERVLFQWKWTDNDNDIYINKLLNILKDLMKEFHFLFMIQN